VFTGIVEEMGVVKAVEMTSEAARFSISCRRLTKELIIGESVSVNGVCLTVATRDDTRFSVDLSQETMRITNLGSLRVGDVVNLERAMQLSDRLGGHLVLGHVDGVGVIRNRSQTGNAILLSVDVPSEVMRYCVKKGSIAMDGVSLTINDLIGHGIVVSIIPHTAAVTTLGVKGEGMSVNLESDLIGRYIERLIQWRPREPPQGIRS